MKKSNLIYFLSFFSIPALILTGCGDSYPEVAKNSTPCDTTTCGAAELVDDLVTMAAYLDPKEKALFVLEEYADTMPQVIGAKSVKDGWFTITHDYGDTTLTFDFRVEPMKTRQDIWAMRMTDPAEESSDANPMRVLASTDTIREEGIVVHDSAECCIVRNLRHEECIRLPIFNHSMKIVENRHSKCKKVNFRKFCVESKWYVRTIIKCRTIDCTLPCDTIAWVDEYICRSP